MKLKRIAYISMIFLLIILINCFTGLAQEKRYEISSGVTEGGWMKIGAGIAEKTNDFFDGFPFTAIPSTGSVGNPPIVSTSSVGKAHFGMSYGPFLLAAKNGEDPFEKPFTNLRAVAALTPTVVHFPIDVEAQVNTVYELLKNKIKFKLGAPSKGGGSYYLAQMIFSKMGLASLEDIKKWGGSIYYAGSSDVIGAWKNRITNAYILAYNVPSSAVEESLIGRKGKLLSIGDELMKILEEEMGFQEFIISAGTYPGQDEDVKTAALPLVIFTREDVSEEAVYFMAKAIYGNKDYMINIHSSFKSFEPDKMATGLGIEMHKGAEKFYKEVGLIN